MADFIIKYLFILSLINAVYAGVVYRKLPRELRVFSWFLALSAITEIVSRVLWVYKNNLPLLHVYVAGGFICLVLFYESILDSFIDKKITRGMGAVFLIFTTINSLFIQSIYTYNSYALTTEAVLVVILSLTTYLIMMEDIVKKRRQDLASSLNWINSGLFIYYASSLLIFYFGDLIAHSLPRKIGLQTWMLHSFFLFIMNICFFIGLWKRPRPHPGS